MRKEEKDTRVEDSQYVAPLATARENEPVPAVPSGAHWVSGAGAGCKNCGHVLTEHIGQQRCPVSGAQVERK